MHSLSAGAFNHSAIGTKLQNLQTYLVIIVNPLDASNQIVSFAADMCCSSVKRGELKKNGIFWYRTSSTARFFVKLARYQRFFFCECVREGHDHFLLKGMITYTIFFYISSWNWKWYYKRLSVFRQKVTKIEIISHLHYHQTVQFPHVLTLMLLLLLNWQKC